MNSRSHLIADLTRRIRCGPLASAEPVILRSLLRESVILRTGAPDQTNAVGNSRFGGLPDLPPALPHPAIEGAPLSLLCQLDLAKVADARLPKTGMLYFFLGMSQSCDDVEVRVIHFPGPKSALKKSPIPTAPWRSEWDDYSANPHHVEFSPSVSLAPYANPGTDNLADSDMIDAFSDLSMAWADEHADEHNLFGYGFSDWQDPRQDAVKRYPNSRLQDWVTLATIGHDRKIGFCFWDAGVLHFLIQKDRLAAGDFSEVYGWLFSS